MTFVKRYSEDSWQGFDGACPSGEQSSWTVATLSEDHE